MADDFDYNEYPVDRTPAKVLHYPRIRCSACGKIVGSKYELFKRYVEEQGLSPLKAFEQLGIKRYCCRREIMSPGIIVSNYAPSYSMSRPDISEDTPSPLVSSSINNISQDYQNRERKKNRTRIKRPDPSKNEKLPEKRKGKVKIKRSPVKTEPEEKEAPIVSQPRPMTGEPRKTIGRFSVKKRSALGRKPIKAPFEEGAYVVNPPTREGETSKPAEVYVGPFAAVERTPSMTEEEYLEKVREPSMKVKKRYRSVVIR